MTHPIWTGVGGADHKPESEADVSHRLDVTHLLRLIADLVAEKEQADRRFFDLHVRWYRGLAATHAGRPHADIEAALTGTDVKDDVPERTGEEVTDVGGES